MTSILDPLVQRIRSRCETPHRAASALGIIILLGPSRPGQGAPTIPRDQLDLEEEMRQAWDDYVERRNAYLVAAGFPVPA
jgi:hypothetical protein